MVSRNVSHCTTPNVVKIKTLTFSSDDIAKRITIATEIVRNIIIAFEIASTIRIVSMLLLILMTVLLRFDASAIRSNIRNWVIYDVNRIRTLA